MAVLSAANRAWSGQLRWCLASPRQPVDKGGLLMQPVAAGLFELDGDGAITLIGGFSHISGHHHFPLGPVCPYTGADDVEQVLLPRDGHLWAWTAVTHPPPGYDGPIPYGFGVVELDGIGLRVVTRLTEPEPSRLRAGQRMTLVTDDLGDHVATWAFAPVPE